MLLDRVKGGKNKNETTAVKFSCNIKIVLISCSLSQMLSCLLQVRKATLHGLCVGVLD